MSEKSLKSLYDILIIGAGPAGLCAGLHVVAGRKDLSVLLVDKMVPWDNPIPCAEGVGKLSFEEAVKVKPSWIRQEIRRASFHAPNGSTIDYTDKNGGYIINRANMQRDIAEELSKNGVECRFNCRIKRVSPFKDGVRKIEFQDGTTFNVKVVIDTSGPICGIGRGEKITWKPRDLEPAYFVLVEQIELEPDKIHIYAGKELAPGGYAWVFPRGEHAANIGIVLGRKHSANINIRTLLDKFLAANFPSVTIVRKFAGTIPCGFKKGPVAVEGLIKAGDAASTINPISRAGIAEAMISGGLAGDYSLRLLEVKSKNAMLRICKEYEKAWNIKRGNRHVKLSKVKRAFINVPDEDYNRGAKLLSEVPLDKMTMSRIFTTALGRFPRLVWAMRHLM